MTEEASITREDGRRLFGLDPAAYAAGRPAYPAEIFDILSARCGLGRGVATLEVGPGTGQATAELLARGASPLVVVEPNAELAAYVATRFGDAVDVRVAAFEEARLEPASFQLATAATSWHWVEQESGLASVAATLVPGGWWATWWTGYHDPEGPDELHHALEPLLEPLPMPPGSGGSGSGFAFEREARLADLDSTAAFGDPHVEELRWSLQLDPQQARALFATFSPILTLSAPERERVLSGIERIVADRFAGLAERRCVTILYTARRNAS